MLDSIEQVQEALGSAVYYADRALATTIFLSAKLRKPLFLEGEAGVGKTEVAKVLAQVLGSRLIRLQCYEGLDANHALYEWNYAKQLLRIKLEEGHTEGREALERSIFSPEYLIRRPLLEAISFEGDVPPVLLIDEVDRADEEFEAFLLEVLSDFQITVPELGTIKAKEPPFVILTSNRTREIQDALKRRCLYMWLDYPTFNRELQIIQAKVPGISEHLATQVGRFMQAVRDMQLYKRPGIAETLDWAMALMALHADELNPQVIRETLGCILKYQEDLAIMNDTTLEDILDRIGLGDIARAMGTR